MDKEIDESFLSQYRSTMEFEKKAQNGRLDMKTIFSNPYSVIAARKWQKYYSEFLQEHFKDFVEIAIGDVEATSRDIQISMQILYSSIKYQFFYCKNYEAFDHIWSVAVFSSPPEIYFHNCISLIHSMVQFSKATVLLYISDPELFFKELLFSTNSRMNEILETIYENEDFFINWAPTFDIFSPIKEILSNPVYKSQSKAIFLYELLLKLYSSNFSFLEKLIVPDIGQNLIDIGLKSSNYKGFVAFRKMLKCIYVDNYKIPIPHLAKHHSDNQNQGQAFLDIIYENFNSLLDLFVRDYFFGPLQKEALYIIIDFIEFGRTFIPAFSHLATHLLHEFLKQQTNSFLHNSYLDYIKKLIYFEKEFREFVFSSDILNIIPAVFSKRKEIIATYWLQLYYLSEIIDTKIADYIDPCSKWVKYVSRHLVPYLSFVREPINNMPKIKHDEMEKHLKNSIQAGTFLVNICKSHDGLPHTNKKPKLNQVFTKTIKRKKQSREKYIWKDNLTSVAPEFEEEVFDDGKDKTRIEIEIKEWEEEEEEEEYLFEEEEESQLDFELTQ
ncbi:hypothetical protein TRFO_07581 [Tritrichomonas foetus]|uniref:Uncharacterized protein n=1 Tax=Tritrichomonas foetus TaxID=1144522 RepID=A0A1J4JUZ9_9EUKA|nr:hypothetical protein TRFO_07581 [Tritrichomonas foetus]|eukprot:OHT01348.1 hypothetical protein TRFO_07581 [Tritrichomonas foetus]